MFTHQHSKTLVSSGGTLSGSNTQQAGGEKRINEPIPAGATDALVAFTLDRAQTKSVFIYASSDLTIKTNSPGAPDDTLNLKANWPYEWNPDDYNSIIFTADITALYVTNPDGSNAVTLRIESLFDPTP